MMVKLVKRIYNNYKIKVQLLVAMDKHLRLVYANGTSVHLQYTFMLQIYIEY